MRRRGNPVTTVRGWKQANLFAHEDLKPFLKDRWKRIRARLLEEDRENTRWGKHGRDPGEAWPQGDSGAMPPVSGAERPSHEKENR